MWVIEGIVFKIPPTTLKNEFYHKIKSQNDTIKPLNPLFLKILVIPIKNFRKTKKS
ncbi:hypothetical protein HMPREF1410_00635 [Helicobacter pylori GAM249T]|nr:hypothetical protein HMPREF1410_00635 [Helicobacter pylori GAM249T]